MPLRRIRNQIRKGLSLAKKTKSRFYDTTSQREGLNLKSTSISAEIEKRSSNSDWSKQTNFSHSGIILQGSSIIKIWFETVEVFKSLINF